MKAIERVYRKEIKITERNVEEHKQYLLGLGLPEILANYISFAVDEDYRGGGALYSEPFYSMAVKNIKKYSSYKPISFEEYLLSENQDNHIAGRLKYKKNCKG